MYVPRYCCRGCGLWALIVVVILHSWTDIMLLSLFCFIITKYAHDLPARTHDLPEEPDQVGFAGKTQ